MSDTNALQVVNWGDQTALAEIKKIYAPNLTPTEFQAFVGIGKSTGLNPFLREIWAVKYGTAAASIFIGRDGYRKSAQANPEYDWHFVDAIYANDTFRVKNGEIEHDYAADRGALSGAYALCKRKSSSRPNFVQVALKEYTTGKSLWTTKPETMIKKVAEAQVLRMTFQELFAGTYEESEQWDDKNEKTVPEPRKNEAPNVGETPTAPATASATLISEQDRDVILDLFRQLGYSDEQIPERIAALEERMGKTFAEFTSGEARDTIKKMRASVESKKLRDADSEAEVTEATVTETVAAPEAEAPAVETVEEEPAPVVETTTVRSDAEMIADLEAKRKAPKTLEEEVAATASEQKYARGVPLDD